MNNLTSLSVNIVSCDQYGHIIVRINNYVYEGRLSGRHVYESLRYIKNKGLLLKKIKENCTLVRSKYVLNSI